MGPGFPAVASVVARTDLIGTVPQRIADHMAASRAVERHDLPLPLPDPEFAMYWHPRSRDDPGHKWLRGRIAALLRT